MFEVYNKITGDSMNVFAESPYLLAGPFSQTADNFKYGENGNIIEIEEINIFDWREISPSLNDIQINKWEEIKIMRKQEQYKPLVYNNLVFDFDKDSQDALSGAISSAQASLLVSLPFPEVEWTLADNSKAILSVNDLIAILFSGLQRTNSIYAYARTLREQIFAEDATKESVEAVNWNYGG